MNIEKFKQQYINIVECVNTLRQFVLSDVTENARETARTVVSTSSAIKLHLNVVDTVLYSAIEAI